MEKVYLKGFSREWHSEKIENLNQYFMSYSNALSGILVKRKTSLKNILNAVLSSETRIASISDKELKHLELLFDVRQLKRTAPKLTGPIKRRRVGAKNKSLQKSPPRKKGTAIQPITKSRITPGENLSEEREGSQKTDSGETNDENVNALDKFGSLKLVPYSTLSKVNKELESQDLPDENKEDPFHSSTGTQSNSFDFKRPKKVSKFKNSILTSRSELILNKFDKKQSGTLHKGKDFLVSFRVHEPFTHNDKGKIENFQQEILVLGHQTLDVLRDKIICQSDFQDVQGDLSESPATPVSRMSRDVYKSAMFYFDNNFYVDCRKEDYVDYSHTVKEWGERRGLRVGLSHDMRDQTVGELKVRFGYPYLYMHQGCCEHLVIVTDARLLSSRDSKRARDYPLLSSIPPYDMTRSCYTCSTTPAEWVVVGSDRMIHDVNLMCKACFTRYHYIGGKKHGHFKAFRYFQRSVIF